MAAAGHLVAAMSPSSSALLAFVNSAMGGFFLLGRAGRRVLVASALKKTHSFRSRVQFAPALFDSRGNLRGTAEFLTPVRSK